MPADARDPDRRPRIVDRFRVRWAGGDGEAPDWDAFRAELMALVRLLRVDRFEEVHHRLIPRFVALMGRFQFDRQNRPVLARFFRRSDRPL